MSTALLDKMTFDRHTGIYLKNVIERTPAYIFWKNIHSVYLGCNHRFACLVGKEFPSDVIGKTDRELEWRQEELDLFIQGDQEVMTGTPKINVEETVITADGSKVIMLVSKVPLRDEYGNCIGVLGISMDITDRKNLEEALKIEKEEAVIARRQAETANELKHQFIQNMQHDIRTPLSGIYQYMQSLAEEEVDPDKKSKIETLIVSAGRLLNMCNEIADFDNIEYLGDNVILTVVESAKFFPLVLDLNKAAASSRGINLAINIDPAVPPLLKLDKIKTHRVLVNLIGNALKFTEKGSISLHVRMLNKENHVATIAIEIQDTGIGIPQNKIEHIFDKFVRITPANRAKYKGSGLGLYYVKKFVTDMKGAVEVESIEGSGSLFRVILPLAIPAAHEKPAVLDDEIENFLPELCTLQQGLPKKGQVLADAPHLSHIQLLVVEDDLMLQNIICNMLTKIGYAGVKIVGSIKEACAAISIAPYDLVICDLGFPDGSGLDIIRWVKSDKTHPNQETPFLVLTANADVKMRQEALESGFLEVLQKPLSIDKARKIIDKYIVKNVPVNTNDISEIYDLKSIMKITQDEALAKEMLMLLSETLPNEKVLLASLQDKNDLDGTRAMMHRLKGCFDYCAVPGLQRVLSNLHDATYHTTDLRTLAVLYEDFNREADKFLQAVKYL